MKCFKIVALFFLFSFLVSCERVVDKAEAVSSEIKTSTKTIAKKQTKKVLENLFPPFDSDKSDTENNFKRFSDFIKVERTEDIMNIYCFDDAIGVDADYMFAFNCNYNSSEKIKKLHHFEKDDINEDNGFGLQHDFDWWDKKKILKLDKYSWTNNKGYHKYFWYDAAENKAYYFEFTL